MIKQALKTFLSTLFLFSATNTFGVPATPHPITKIQPDGSELTVYLKGDEFHKYELTLDGYLVKRDVAGYYKYHKLDKNGETVSTGVKANQIEQRTNNEKQLIKALTKLPDFSKINQEKRMAKAAAASDNKVIQKVFPNAGSQKSLVILVNFKDISFVTENPKTAFTDLLNEEDYSTNGGTGSARDYFKVASHGASSPLFEVVGPYTLLNNRSYYGANDKNGQDVRPDQMVVDACKAASNDGIDFSQYDTDGDGLVDNVFIYYAGHNEAEGGAEESIWPHRWALANVPIQKFNGKRVYDYACTSELRGSKGTSMCGIGTFCHEFGHVYGLPDYYNTDGSAQTEHHTLSDWNIMDGGAYLNKGRTPPTYSAYDRFYLGWLTPILLNSPSEIELHDIKTSNQAYIITESGNHNLDGLNPNPVEFFTLENRQRTGWDAYLPNSGMLITRIYYKESDWDINGPNNKARTMGVDIMEADGIANEATKSGDPFPGSQNVTSFSPTLRSGVDISSPLTEIKETNEIISFKFMGGKNPLAIHSDHTSITPFSTVYGTPSVIQEFTVSGSNIPNGLTIKYILNTHFELKRKDDPSTLWVKSLTLATVDSILDSTIVLVRYNPTEPSFKELHTDHLNFMIGNKVINQGEVIGNSSRPIYVAPPIATPPSAVSLNGFTANWTAINDATGYYLTIYNVSEGTTALKEGFDNDLTPSVGWTINAPALVSLKGYFGDSAPSIHFKNTGNSIQTEAFNFPVTDFSFYIRSMGEANGKLKVEATAGQGWDLLENINVTTTLIGVQTYHLPELSNYNQFRIVYQKGTDSTVSVAIDDVTVTLAEHVEFINRNTWVTEDSARVDFILPGRKYHYSVKASDKTYYDDKKTIKYENITEDSNTISVSLNKDGIVQFTAKNNPIAIFKDSDGVVVLDKSKVIGENAHIIYVYSIDGRLLKTIESTNHMVTLSPLPKGQLYIVKIGESVIKLVL